MIENRKRKHFEIKDDEKEKFKQEINDFKKVKHDLEIEVMALTTELERIENVQNNMNQGAVKIAWSGVESNSSYLSPKINT